MESADTMKNNSRTAIAKVFSSHFFNVSYIVITSILLVSIFSICVYSYIQSKKVITVTTDETGKSSNSNYSFSCAVSKTWTDTGKLKISQMCNCNFFNFSPVRAKNWSAELIVPRGGVLDSYWNGRYLYASGKLYVHPLEYNSSIDSHSQARFGFVLRTEESFSVTQVKFSFEQDIKPTYFKSFWTISFLLCIQLIVGITTMFNMIRYHRLIKLLDETFNAFANIIDIKDEYTYSHSRHVAYYARELGRKLGMNKEERQRLYYVALLHDIGKVAIPESILNNPGKLSPEDRLIINTHVTKGAETIKDFTEIPEICDGVKYHHERYDGTGYAQGLKGKKIPLFARIICVADSFDAMSTQRCYRNRMKLTDIVEELKRCSGTQFDPDIVPYMIELIEEKKAPATDEILKSAQQ